MMRDFEFSLKTRFIFGKHADARAGAELAAKGLTAVTICHNGSRFLYDGGLLDGVKNALDAAGVRWGEFMCGTEPNPRLSRVYQCIEAVRAAGSRGLLAIGGGAVIDHTKAVAAGVPYDGDVWDFFTGRAAIRAALPVAALLTNPASGSESSGVMVINNAETSEKRLASSPFIQPELALMNPDITRSLPASVTANGLVDMFSHIAERYFTNDAEFGIIDHMAEGAMAAVASFGPKLLENLDSYELRAQAMWTAAIAHNDTLGVGRAQDWATHIIANELSALYDTPHGVSLSVIMPAWMQYVYKNDEARFARYGRRVFGLEGAGAARECIAATKGFFRCLGMPVSFAQAGIPTDSLGKLADMTQMPENGLIGASTPLTRADVAQILELAR
jgi:alcohol dehydrogenase YqhD (iron-dependent ADH family)